jgi:hypothetical protein
MLIHNPVAATALIVVALAAAPVAYADPGAYSSQDETFFRLLTEGSDANPGITVSNPPLVRAQGLLVCQRASQGMDTFDALHFLMSEGPYPFDVASDIASAAIVAYCPEYGDF